jgi:hypothetical protein
MQPYQSSDHQTGGRRMGGERRDYSYASCIPERRGGLDRRSGKDRRRQSRMTSILVSGDESAFDRYEPILQGMD